MRVLFLIPKNNPPQLTGNYTKQFKEFVEACLNKDPENVSTFFIVIFFFCITFLYKIIICVLETNCKRTFKISIHQKS